MAYFPEPKITTSIANRPSKKFNIDGIEITKPRYSVPRTKCKPPPINEPPPLKRIGGEEHHRIQAKFSVDFYKMMCGPQPEDRKIYSQREIAKRLENG